MEEWCDLLLGILEADLPDLPARSRAARERVADEEWEQPSSHEGSNGRSGSCAADRGLARFKLIIPVARGSTVPGPCGPVAIRMPLPPSNRSFKTEV